MNEISRKQSIFLQWLSWRFLDVTKGILMAWGNFLKFGLNYFSLPLLLKTLFSPWRRYTWKYSKTFDIGQYSEVFFSNLISRILGLTFRLFLIFFGLLTEIFFIFGGLFVLFIWFILPFLIIVGFYFGFKILL